MLQRLTKAPSSPDPALLSTSHLPWSHPGIQPRDQFTSAGLAPAEMKRLENREAVICEVKLSSIKTGTFYIATH